MLDNIHDGRAPPARDPPARDPPDPRGHGPPCFDTLLVIAGYTTTAENTTSAQRLHGSTAPQDRLATDLGAPKILFSHGYNRLAMIRDRHQDRHRAPARRTGRGEEEAGLPNALFDLSGSKFWNPATTFGILHNGAADVEIDPPPSRFSGELRPVLPTGWAPGSVTRQNGLHVFMDGRPMNPESFGQLVLLMGLELARGQQFDELQATFVSEPLALRVIPSATCNKVQHLFFAYIFESVRNFPLHALRLSFLTCITQVLAAANLYIAGTEVLSIKDSLDKSTGVCIIVVVRGRQASTTDEDYNRLSHQSPTIRPDVGSNPTYSTLLLETWKGHEATAGCQGDKDMSASELERIFEDGEATCNDCDEHILLGDSFAVYEFDNGKQEITCAMCSDIRADEAIADGRMVQAEDGSYFDPALFPELKQKGA